MRQKNFPFKRYFRLRYNLKSTKIELVVKFRIQEISYLRKFFEKTINLAYFRSRPKVRKLIFYDSKSESNFASSLFSRYFRLRYNYKSIKIELLIKFRIQKISNLGKLLEKKFNLTFFRFRPEVRRLIFYDLESELNSASF